MQKGKPQLSLVPSPTTSTKEGASATPSSVVIRVLYVDSVVDRSNLFRMTSKLSPKPSFLFRIVRAPLQLAQSLYNEKWDVLIHTLAVGVEVQDPLSTIGMVASAHERGHLRGVIVASSVVNEGIRYVRALRALGVPAKFYPYNYSEPSKHEELMVEAKLEVKPR